MSAGPLPVTVMLVEDDDSTRTALAMALSAFGFLVLATGDGRAALDMAAVTTPDVFVTDLTMPILDGYQLCAAIRADPVLMHIPIVIVSSSGAPLASAPCLHDAYFQKPVDIAALAATLTTLAARSPPAASADVHDDRE